MKHFKYLYSFLILGFCFSLEAQNLSREQIQASYIYNFSKNITWSNQSSLQGFRILLVGAPNARLHEVFKRLAKQKKIKGLPISVLQSRSLSNAPKAEIIFLHDSSTKLKDFYKKKWRNSLVISNNYSNKNLVMINFYQSRGQKLLFEINKANILNQGLMIDSKIILYGGTEIDVAKLYLEGQSKLVRLENQVANKESLLQQQEQNILIKTAELKRQNIAIAKQKELVSSQAISIAVQKSKLKLAMARSEEQVKKNSKLESELSLLSQEIRKTQVVITQQEGLLAKQKSLLSRQKSEKGKLLLEIRKIENSLNTQAQKVASQHKIIETQTEEITSRERRIASIHQSIEDNQQILSEQKKYISQQKIQITSQENALRLLYVVISLIGIIVIIVYFAYRQRKKTLALVRSERDKLASTLMQLEETQAELLVAKDAALEASNTKSQFLANMSHEIRTPMNAILGFTELLKGSVQDPQSIRFLDSVHASGKSLLRLINDILDLSKIEAGKIEIEYSALNPHHLFSELEIIFANKSSEKGIDFILEIDPSLPKALILDETRIRQILFNLISNAIKFTSEGYVKVAVSQENHDASSLALIFSVSDSGEGIPEEEKERIFEPFVQKSQQSHAKFGGTGLGLSICKRLVKLMNGEMTVGETAEGGAVFSVKLYDVDVAVAPTVQHDHEKIETKNIHFEPATILIADDVELNRELIENYLKAYNFTLLMAHNGLDACRLARHKQPELILLDMKMPVMDGYEASKKLKSQETTAHIPIIAITASAMKSSEIEIRKTCDSYLRKPVNQAELLYAISKFLKHEIKEEIVCDKLEKAKGLSPSNDLQKEIAASEELKTSLQSEALPMIKEFLAVPDMALIEELIETLQQINQRLHSDSLENFSEQLKSSYLSFDIESINNSLNHLEELIS